VCEAARSTPTNSEETASTKRQRRVGAGDAGDGGVTHDGGR
jgi:hypothetical protein